MKKIFLISLTFTMLACNAKQQKSAVQTPAAAPAQSAAAASTRTVTGPVLETMNSGGYTYMKIGDLWAAVPETTVTKGQTVSIDVQMVMDNFESKTLNRKFERLAFATIAGAAAPQKVQPVSMASAMPAALATAVTEKPAGAKSVAEVWQQKKELADKTVVVRGKVVKALGGIMGKNWIHVRDGSGARDKGTDDLTVTTDGMRKVGDVVTVTGTLRVDKDFGAGYKYPVIIEDAKLQE